MNIVDFIEARITEDEQIATAAAGHRWTWDRIEETFHVHGDAHDIATIHTGPVDPSKVYVAGQQRANTVHIARHDPARVLREVEAKRMTLDLCLQWMGESVTDPTILVIGSRQNGKANRMHAGAILTLLAAPYSDHPDYDTTWS